VVTARHQKECGTAVFVFGHDELLLGSTSRHQAVLDDHGWSSRATTLLSAVRQEAPAQPLPGMYDDARAIRAAINGTAGPLIVVAHSYGGVPATEAIAGAPNVVHAVYVAAYMLGRG
jgi:predicted alpha/beta hydrolase family esterase